jgi:hypothetical protein
MNSMAKRKQVLGAIAPVAYYGLQETAYTSVQRAMYEVAVISYLMGRGYDFQTAHMIAESWEVGEEHPPYQGSVQPAFGLGTVNI